MRILVTGDFHVDATTAGVARFDDVRLAADEVVEKAINESVDLFVFVGDLCNPDAGSVVLRAVELAQRVAGNLARGGIDSVWIAGNHDVVDDGLGRSTLTPLSTMRCDGVLVSEVAPRLFRAGDVDLLTLPYPPRAMRYDPEQAVADLIARRGDTKCPLIAVGHLQIEGAQLGSESIDMARGADVAYPHALLARAGARLMFNGHYHRRQTASGIICPGSLERLRFDEEQNRPGWIVADVED
jgi:DNA repair exonuclease SbcCD nuclease subunit